MFSRKPKALEERIITIPQDDPGVPLEERLVACRDCKHLLYKRDAQRVLRRVLPVFRRWTWTGESAELFYYCPAHQKSWDYIESNPETGEIRYYRTIAAVPARHELVCSEGPPAAAEKTTRESAKPSKPG